jgi:two-component system sensor histidine kinase YesM
MPPLLLQPFVENSVVHGLEPLVRGGRVTISVIARESGIRVRIADNGRGMSPIALARARAAIAGDPSDGKGGSTTQEPRLESHGLGISNALERIRLFYGSKASVGIYSREGRGSLIRLSLPWSSEMFGAEVVEPADGPGGEGEAYV